MSERSDVYKVEYPQQGITIHYGSEPSGPFDSMASSAFEALGVMICFLPILYLIHMWLRDRADRECAEAIVKQGNKEADYQSDLRRKRQGESKKSS